MKHDPVRILDEWLVLRAQDGDRSALETLMQRWHSRLLRHAVHLLGNRDEAADVTQQSCLEMVRRLHTLRDPASFPAWAYRIVTNKSADWIRRRTRDRRAHAEMAAQRTSREYGESREPTGDFGDRNDETIARLREALRMLPGDRRSLLTMFYLEEMRVSEIARALDIPAGTVKSRLFHARRDLARVLERTKR